MPRLPYLTAEEIRGSGRGEVRRVMRLAEGDIQARACGLAGELFPLPERRRQIRVLDCGAGSGLYAAKLAALGFGNIAAVDIEDYRADEYRGAMREFKAADLSADPLPWPEASFGLITALCLLPHLENPHHFLREVRRAITEDGVFLTSLPHIGSLLARKLYFLTGEIEHYPVANNHISVFTPAVFTKTVLRYFTLQRVEYWTDIGKIRRGRLGRLKTFGLGRGWRPFGRWFGHEVIYILNPR